MSSSKRKQAAFSATDEQRLPGGIEQKFRELLEPKRDDAPSERARAKEAEAAVRKEVRELKAKMRTFAKEFCREHANRPRPRKKAASRSEAELRKLGGKKEMVQRSDGLQPRIVFGGKGETHLIFTPEDGAWMVALEGAWKIKLEGKATTNETPEELKRELNKYGRNLWNVPELEQQPDIAATEQKPAVGEDKQKGKPDIAFQAVDALLSCWRDWQDFTALPESEQEKADVYRAMINVQLAISATLLALKRDVKNKGRKLQVAFELLKDFRMKGKDAPWPSQIRKLRDHLMNLAVELQRPPSKWELRKDFDPQERIQPTNFATLLKRAGLSWLPKKSR